MSRRATIRAQRRDEAAVVLIVGVRLALSLDIAAGVVALRMIGAIAMHVKGSDPPMKSVPAARMLAMSVVIILL